MNTGENGGQSGGQNGDEESHQSREREADAAPAPDAPPAPNTPPVNPIRVVPCQGDIDIEIDHRASLPPDSAALASRWAALCAENPRMHDGPVLAVASIDTPADPAAPHAVTRVRARVDAYRRLAVQPRVRTGVRLLGVTLVIVGAVDGRAAFLVARRGAGVRCYASAWELGPSGGVGVPPATITRVTTADIARAALDELEEELGEAAAQLAPGPASLSVRALVHDDVANSVDVVLASSTPVAPDFARVLATTWEYSHFAWIPCEDVVAWADAHAAEVAPPTRALVAHWRALMPMG